ncbi:hypothetical protein FZ041_10645 [Selenomonas caprae]|uniref:DUF1659 domain-containing protein n=1 Tax=Selenomonas caprae TaxID=2606905 RepID=A0A5D6WHZ4_9FIRM|nr:hypothetical protein [Selenomonas caprae]TYZ27693.1 hypothetical protein FZ041_10645 [Selenomonas caprae]
MRKKAASVLKIGCEYGYDEYGAHCRYLHFNVNPEANDKDLLEAVNAIVGMIYLPLHSVERLDSCELTKEG